MVLLVALVTAGIVVTKSDVVELSDERTSRAGGDFGFGLRRDTVSHCSLGWFLAMATGCCGKATWFVSTAVLLKLERNGGARLAPTDCNMAATVVNVYLGAVVPYNNGLLIMSFGKS